jgi:hypothetical protein
MASAESPAAAEATTMRSSAAKRQRAEGSHRDDDYDANHLFHIF